MNPFIIWSSHQLRKLAQENPGKRKPGIAQRLGSEWKLLSEGDKEPFIEEANRLKAVHKEMHPDYKFRPRNMAKKDPSGQQDGMIILLLFE